ncbi:MAG TPA: MoaD/ThiS family protein [Chthoniobacteraceae bacterium]
MQVRLLAFAQTAQQAGFHERLVECSPEETPRQIWQRVAPTVKTEGLRVAVDCEYHEWDAPIGPTEEVALIPPVSGG